MVDIELNENIMDGCLEGVIGQNKPLSIEWPLINFKKGYIIYFVLMTITIINFYSCMQMSINLIST